MAESKSKVVGKEDWHLRGVGERGYKGQENTSAGNGYVHYLDCGNDFIGVYLCLN